MFYTCEGPAPPAPPTISLPAGKPTDLATDAADAAGSFGPSPLMVGGLLTCRTKEALKGLLVLRCSSSNPITSGHPSADTPSPCPTLCLHKSPPSVYRLPAPFRRFTLLPHSCSVCLTFTQNRSFSSQQEATLCAQAEVTTTIMKNQEASVSSSL